MTTKRGIVRMKQFDSIANGELLRRLPNYQKNCRDRRCINKLRMYCGLLVMGHCNPRVVYDIMWKVTKNDSRTNRLEDALRASQPIIKDNGEPTQNDDSPECNHNFSNHLLYAVLSSSRSQIFPKSIKNSHASSALYIYTSASHL